ncbi:MAG: hypothetical protein GY713_18505 [Actinomycetia bacterium]|nr:hypothetical protein [Actinomycetes bacterium]
MAVPGVHEIRAGDRVIDAIEAAGGLTVSADRTRLNLALIVADQQRVWVPSVGEPEPTVIVPTGGSESVSGASTNGAGPLVNINQADAGQLETLPGIGPSLAAAIVDHRAREGPFQSVDGLLDVAGIGPAKLAQLGPQATI